MDRRGTVSSCAHEGNTSQSVRWLSIGLIISVHYKEKRMEEQENGIL